MADASSEDLATERALHRIEAALSRLERAAERPSPIDGNLRARHDRLKDAVARSLDQLDALIARQDR